ncbi:hypothetical protein CRM22_005894 [Opisthorchis felineus]|uniref:Uncharacterized protein n=1 Tax=Opisthorchis felineus TaxID=147828 RepID=A0A4S2LNZ3_OPIFE|nr:hypothetical protein CRM22_005894 [Opisthorchis felineus]TGZ65430.1 hypothetical protein CRM22_005894 [Opisthorchis felineus]
MGDSTPCDITKTFKEYFEGKGYATFEDLEKDVRVFQKCTETLYVIKESAPHPDKAFRKVTYMCYLNVLPHSKGRRSSLLVDNCPALFEVSLIGDMFKTTSQYIVHNHELGAPGYLLNDFSDILTPSEIEELEPKLVRDYSVIKKFALDRFKKRLTDGDICNLRRNHQEDMLDLCTPEQRRLCLSPELFVLGLPAWDISSYFDKYLGSKLFETYTSFMENLKKFEMATGSIYAMRDAKKIPENSSEGNDKLVYKAATFRCTNPRCVPEPAKDNGPKTSECRAYLKLGLKFNKLCVVAVNNQHSHFFYPRGRLLRQTNVRCPPKPTTTPKPAPVVDSSPKTVAVSPVPAPSSLQVSTPIAIPVMPLEQPTVQPLVQRVTPVIDRKPKQSLVTASPSIPTVPASGTNKPSQPGQQKTRMSELSPYLRLLALLVEGDESKYLNRKRLLLNLIEAWTNEQKVDLFVHQFSHSAD